MVKDEALVELEELLGHEFNDREVLRRALRHDSSMVADEHGSYQRLEFLGDAVLGNAVALLLFEEFPHADQGALTRMRSHLTRASTLSGKAAMLGLDGYVEVGPSEEISRGRERNALLEDLFEAVVGALMVDAGWEVAFDFVCSQFEEDLDELDERTLALADPKTALQEAAQARGVTLPVYRQAGATGPDHKRHWVYEVLWNGEVMARGEGRSKRAAQAQAARRALERLGFVPE